ncbi:MAG TPA: ribonuclease D [Acetobacteraceae bacterium]|jgi:ribonuclease D
MPRPQRADVIPRLITTADDLDQLCRKLAAEEFVTVDTEFMRERTYWPELCVVQLAGDHDVAVIDAQAEGMDLAPLGQLLADTNVLKVFHAARQDNEIFVLRFNAVPTPLFDTQIAAMVAGFGDQVGYDALVGGLTGRPIDKAHRFSDWSARPLSPAQIAYAANDVTHLRDVYRRLCDRLRRDNRLDWVAEEMAALADPAFYRADPETAWERLKPRSGNRRFLGRLQALAAWREREAQRVNIPRQRLVRDEALLEIAATAPADVEALARMRGVSRGFAEGRIGESLLEAIAAAQNVPDSALPPAPPPRDALRPSPALVSLLKVLLHTKCEHHHVAPKLIASSEEIDRLALEDTPDIPALHGWRREVFGEDALALKQGRIALSAAGREVKLVPA